MAEEEGEERPGIEHQVEKAVSSRLQHFKDQADSLTLESVRRLLEKDLGLEKFALDAHKRFIRHYLEKQMEGADDCNSKVETKDEDKDVHLSKQDATRLPNTKDDPKKPIITRDEEIMDDSPIMGVLTPKSEVDTQGSLVSESRIKKAIWERADHFLANSENITLVGVRRLLEEDLGLNKNTLDPFKKFISQQIDQVLNSPKGAKSVKDVKSKTSDRVKKSEKMSSEDESESSGSDKVKSKKESARTKRKLEEPRKRKLSKETDTGIVSKKQKKPLKRQKEEDNDSGEHGNMSEDGQSQSSTEKPAQRREKSVPGYGKRVENLKSIIKACGMSVPPSIYKKAKQVPDDKRETFLVKELEGILSREGLSRNPTEKEIKDCKKRKETARELEGIDMSNIISSSRRRSTFSFVTTLEPGLRAKGSKADAKDVKKKKENEKDHKDEEKKDEYEVEKKKDQEVKAEEEVEEEKEEEEEEEKEEEEEDDDDESEEFNEDDNEESD